MMCVGFGGIQAGCGCPVQDEAGLVNIMLLPLPVPLQMLN